MRHLSDDQINWCINKIRLPYWNLPEVSKRKLADDLELGISPMNYLHSPFALRELLEEKFSLVYSAGLFQAKKGSTVVEDKDPQRALALAFLKRHMRKHPLPQLPPNLT